MVRLLGSINTGISSNCNILILSAIMTDKNESQLLLRHQSILEQNEDLIAAIVENLQLGRHNDCLIHYQMLQSNLLGLANEIDNYPTDDHKIYENLKSMPDTLFRSDCLDELRPKQDLRVTPGYGKAELAPCYNCMTNDIPAHTCRVTLEHVHPSAKLGRKEHAAFVAATKALYVQYNDMRSRNSNNGNERQRSTTNKSNTYTSRSLYQKWDADEKYTLLLGLGLYGKSKNRYQQIAGILSNRSASQVSAQVEKLPKETLANAMEMILPEAPANYEMPELVKKLVISRRNSNKHKAAAPPTLNDTYTLARHENVVNGLPTDINSALQRPQSTERESLVGLELGFANNASSSLAPAGGNWTSLMGLVTGTQLGKEVPTMPLTTLQSNNSPKRTNELLQSTTTPIPISSNTGNNTTAIAENKMSYSSQVPGPNGFMPELGGNMTMKLTGYENYPALTVFNSMIGYGLSSSLISGVKQVNTPTVVAISDVLEGVVQLPNMEKLGLDKLRTPIDPKYNPEKDGLYKVVQKHRDAVTRAVYGETFADLQAKAERKRLEKEKRENEKAEKERLKLEKVKERQRLKKEKEEQKEREKELAIANGTKRRYKKRKTKKEIEAEREAELARQSNYSSLTVLQPSHAGGNGDDDDVSDSDSDNGMEAITLTATVMVPKKRSRQANGSNADTAATMLGANMLQDLGASGLLAQQAQMMATGRVEELHDSEKEAVTAANMNASSSSQINNNTTSKPKTKSRRDKKVHNDNKHKHKKSRKDAVTSDVEFMSSLDLGLSSPMQATRVRSNSFTNQILQLPAQTTSLLNMDDDMSLGASMMANAFHLPGLSNAPLPMTSMGHNPFQDDGASQLGGASHLGIGNSGASMMGPVGGENPGGGGAIGEGFTLFNVDFGGDSNLPPDTTTNTTATGAGDQQSNSGK